MTSLFILLQESADPAGGGYFQFIFFIGIIAIFYFFMIRPQQKKAKEEKKFRESMEKGDKVISIGGIHGVVEAIDDDSVLVKVDQSTKLRFEKSALKSPAAPAPAK